MSIHRKAVTYVRIRCVELARRKNAVLVAYQGKEIWFTLQFLKGIEQSDDGYTRMSVPDWLFRDRLSRHEEKPHVIRNKINKERREMIELADKKRNDIQRASNYFGYYDGGKQ